MFFERVRCGAVFRKGPAVPARLLAGCRSSIAVTDNAPYAGYWRLVFNKSSYQLFQPFLTTCAQGSTPVGNIYYIGGQYII